MSLIISPTLTNWQAKSSVGASQTSYTNSSNPSQSEPINRSKRYDTGFIKDERRDAQIALNHKFSEISRSTKKVDRGEFLAALIKFRSLAKYEQALNKWESYVSELYSEAELIDSGFSTKVLDNARQTLKKLNSHFRGDHLFLEVPDACPGESDNFMFVWDKGDNYLECEIFGDGEVEFFYRNRSTNELWGEDIAINAKLTPAIMKKLMLFVTTEK